jgi:methylenetetrahydrofolate dehydrogenase (NADP+) / methenyltetrahydrofolate cyclohydrolase
MTAQILDGQAIADRIRAQIATETAQFKAKYGYAPGLGAVLAGDNPASAQYVRMKRKACDQVGFTSIAHMMTAESTQEEVEAAVKSLNDDPMVHGILVQLPLPSHIDEQRVLSLVSLEKDVDGFHPINIGLLAMKGRDPLFTPATPTGCMVLLQEAGAQVSGANAVVLGRSNIVGLPVALMLIKANATVTGRDYQRPRRRRTDDHRHAAAKYAQSRPPHRRARNQKLITKINPLNFRGAIYCVLLYSPVIAYQFSCPLYLLHIYSG